MACSSACGRVWRDLFTGPTRCRAGTVTYASEPSRLAGWLVLPCRRDYATRDDSSTHQSFSSKTRRVCYGGDTRTHVGLPFKLTSTDAHAALKKWTKRKPFRPWSLRDGNAHKPSLKTVFLPHWVFQCEISVKYRGVVGYDAGGGKVTWTAIDTWRDGGSTKYDSSSKETQICASFGHRRDLLSALHGKHVGSLPGRNKNANEELDDTRASSSKINLISMPDRVQASLDASKFGAGPPGQIHVERFSMKRSLAWELAFRRVRESEREKATELLKRNHKADAVRDVALDITLSPKRHVKAVLLPAFIAHFTHGEVRGPSGDASPRKHVAVVCGVTGNVVVDEDVVDVGKARTAAVVGGVFLPALCAHFCLGPEFAGEYFPLTTFRLPVCPYETDTFFFTIRNHRGANRVGVSPRVRCRGRVRQVRVGLTFPNSKSRLPVCRLSRVLQCTARLCPARLLRDCLRNTHGPKV